MKVARRIRVPMGFIFALFYLLIAHPSVHSLLWSLLGTVPGLILRGYASGYLTKNIGLTMTGPYAYTRNPLYLGSMLIAFGFAVAAHSWWMALALAILFTLIYWPTIRLEEEYLGQAFPDFAEYVRSVPRLIPRLTPASPAVAQSDAAQRGRFSAVLYRKHREYNALLGSICIYAVLLLRLYVWQRSVFLHLR